METDQERRRRLSLEVARKELAEGTWPQVMAVFGYPNTNVPRASAEEFVRLKELFTQAGLEHIAAFTELLQFLEAEHGVTLSFNLSLRARVVPGHTPEPTAKNMARLVFQPDLLIGSRGGNEGGFLWLNGFSKWMTQTPLEFAQRIDRIVEEALPFLREKFHPVTMRELFASALSGAPLTIEKEEKKH